MVFCAGCGASREGDSKFCAGCGAAFPDALPFQLNMGDDEPEREHSTIWQVEMPPLLESATGDMEDENTLQTLEERILRRYTPSRLDMDAYTVPQKAAFVAHTSGGLDDNSHESSPIKPCPACFGVGKLYTQQGMSDSVLGGKRASGVSLLEAPVTRVMESCCTECGGTALVGGSKLAQAEQTKHSDPVAADRAKKAQPFARIENTNGIEMEIDDSSIEAQFGPSPFLKKEMMSSRCCSR